MASESRHDVTMGGRAIVARISETVGQEERGRGQLDLEGADAMGYVYDISTATLKPNRTVGFRVQAVVLAQFPT